MKWLQELLLGEQTPSPTLSRSSSVSSVLMVSICTRPKWKFNCFLVGPKHPPLCQPRCPRGEDDASSTDKNPATGETRLKATKYYFNNAMLTEIPNISCFHPKSPPSSRWAGRKAKRPHQHLCNETTTRSYLCNETVPSLFLSKRTHSLQEEEGELVRRGRREGWRRRTSDWKSRCPDSTLL